MSQPLFRDFGRMTNVEGVTRARNQLRATQREYHRQLAELVVEVVDTFERLVRLEGQIRSDEAFFARLDRLSKLTRARERQGHTTRVDTLRVDLQRGQASSRLEFSRERLAWTQRDFAELLGFAPDTSFVLIPPPLLEIALPSTEAAVETALHHRLDYAQAIQDYEDSVRSLAIAKRSLQPAFSLVTTYQRSGDGTSFSEARGLEQDNWFVGLTADSDFNPVLQRSAVRQAELDESAAAQAVKISELSIAREVQQALIAYRRVQIDLDMADRNLKLAQSRAKVAQRLFEAGRGDNFSVTDAEEAFALAREQVLHARATASVSGYRLLQTLGTLVQFPEDLKPDPEQVASLAAETPFVGTGEAPTALRVRLPTATSAEENGRETADPAGEGEQYE